MVASLSSLTETGDDGQRTRPARADFKADAFKRSALETDGGCIGAYTAPLYWASADVLAVAHNAMPAIESQHMYGRILFARSASFR
jgi:hypothetical protein